MEKGADAVLCQLVQLFDTQEVNIWWSCIYINDSFTYTKREDLSIFIPHVFESIFFEVQNNKNKPIIVIIIIIIMLSVAKRQRLLPSLDSCSPFVSLL